MLVFFSDSLVGLTIIGALRSRLPSLKKVGGVSFLDVDLMVHSTSAKLWWNFHTDVFTMGEFHEGEVL